MKNKKKKILISICVILALCLVVFLFIKVLALVSPILIEKSYTGGAWSEIYEGKILLKNGWICKFNFNQKASLKNVRFYSINLALRSWLTKEKMDKNDLKRLNELLKNVKNEIAPHELTEEEKDNVFYAATSYDLGSHGTYYYNYDTNERIALDLGGEINYDNLSDGIDEILQILRKYDLN